MSFGSDNETSALGLPFPPLSVSDLPTSPLGSPPRSPMAAQANFFSRAGESLSSSFLSPPQLLTPEGREGCSHPSWLPAIPEWVVGEKMIRSESGQERLVQSPEPAVGHKLCLSCNESLGPYYFRKPPLSAQKNTPLQRYLPIKTSERFVPSLSPLEKPDIRMPITASLRRIPAFSTQDQTAVIKGPCRRCHSRVVARGAFCESCRTILERPSFE
jgi:hypothetical protein